MSQRKKLGLFGGFGVEMEYMIVHQDTLEVLPISDEILKAEAGEITSDVERGEMGWSNELVMHVLELKTNGPAAALPPLSILFHAEVRRINILLEPYQGMLLPTGAHPFMDPFTQTKLWPHDASEIYEAYNKVFDCRGHGWSNLQSTHLNLPFADDEEFGRLHAAIRLLLPLIPAVSAASPIMDGKITGFLDTRLEVYRKNQQKIPEIAGQVVPEAVFSEQEYNSRIFNPMFKAIQPYDQEGILQEEFLNSRGAIARFSRGAIEIRIIDNQECPLADISLVTLFTEVLKELVAESWSTYEDQKALSTESLSSFLLSSSKNGSKTLIQSKDYLAALGIPTSESTVGEVWQILWGRFQKKEVFTPEITAAIQLILEKGSVSERILHAIKSDESLENIKNVYRQLASCLAQNKLLMQD